MPEWMLFILLLGLLPIMLLALPFYAIYTHHRRKMEELRLQQRGNVSEPVRAELNALREEVRQLRDTSMSYDISFDSALQRMEQRVGNIETQNRRPHTEQDREQTLYNTH